MAGTQAGPRPDPDAGAASPLRVSEPLSFGTNEEIWARAGFPIYGSQVARMDKRALKRGRDVSILVFIVPVWRPGDSLV